MKVHTILILLSVFRVWLGALVFVRFPLPSEIWISFKPETNIPCIPAFSGYQYRSFSSQLIQIKTSLIMTLVLSLPHTCLVLVASIIVCLGSGILRTWVNVCVFRIGSLIQNRFPGCLADMNFQLTLLCVSLTMMRLI